MRRYGWPTLDEFERRVLIGYLLNVVEQLPARDRRVVELRDFIASDGRQLGLAPCGVKLRLDGLGVPLNASSYLRSCRAMLRRHLGRSTDCEPSLCETNLRRLADLLGLDEVEIRTLGCLVRLKTSRAWEHALQMLGSGDLSLANRSFVELFAMMLGATESDAYAWLGPASRLRTSGLIAYDGADLGPAGKVRHLWSRPFSSVAEMREFLLGKPAAARLTREDFAHVSAELSHAAALIKGAIAAKRQGVHILVYGAVGTGKTEFCKTAAALVGVPVFMVGERDDHEFEPNRHERLSSHLVNQNLLRTGHPAILLFDEMEDLFSDLVGPSPLPIQRPGSKVFVNRLLEEASIPTLWTANDLSVIGPAVLRRMTYAVELKSPPTSLRTRLWRRETDRQGLPLTDAEVGELARRFEASPALIENAVGAAVMSGGGIEAVHRTVGAMTKIVNSGRNPTQTTTRHIEFDPALACADTDLEWIAERLIAAGDRRRISLCLSGPPGTGKSAFVRFLAQKFNIELMQKRVSDLFSPWVGNTEKQIAETFEDARTAGAFLCFDEADSLLLDRRAASHSWEITQVNEMLTWMENHPLPFACTTNLPERLDPAALRRFTLQIRFDYLTIAQSDLAFRRFFGAEPPPGLRDLVSLTPGDFAVVADRAALLGIGREAISLLRMLEQECLAKPGRGQVCLGFVRPRRS